MKVPRLAVLMVCAASLASPFSCSAQHNGSALPEASSGAGGELAAGGASEAGDAPIAGSASGTDDESIGWSASASTCVEHPTPQRKNGTVVSLLLRPVLEGNPFVFGQLNPLASGDSLIPLNFRFYISEVELLRHDGTTTAVDLVTETGDLEPYGVHLFNAEEDESSSMRVLAPAGEYEGLRFALGIKLACNKLAATALGDPLSDASQMTWPHTGGFLYLRYEGRSAEADGAGAGGSAGAGGAAGDSSAGLEILPAVHMGGNLVKELVPHVTVSGSLLVPQSGTLGYGLRVVMDEIFKGATSDIDVSDTSIGFRSTPEAVAGERLRRDLPELHVFELEPPVMSP